MDTFWIWKFFYFLTYSTLSLALCPNKDGVIDLSSQGLTFINASVFVDCPADAHTLLLSGNYITKIHNNSFLEGNAVKFYQLITLDLSNNSIEHIDVTAFGLLRRLELLNLSGNYLTKLQSILLDNKFYLRTVDFSHNNISDIGDEVFTKTHNNLRYVNISHNSLSFMEPWPYIPPNLLQFNLSHNQIFTFTNRMNWQYDLSEPYHANTDLRFNQLVHWNDSYFQQYNNDPDADFATDFVTYQMDMRNNPWFCDCNVHYFSKRYQNSFYKHADTKLLEVKCEGPPELKNKAIFNDVGLDELVCNLTTDCPNGCLCQDQPENNILNINCTGTNMTTMPDKLPYNPYNRTDLILDHNSINVFEMRPYTSNIISLSIEGNKLTKMDDGAVREMKDLQALNIENNQLQELPKSIQYSARFEIVDLKRNHFVCSCSMVWMRDWISLAPEDDDDRDVMCRNNDENVKIIDVTESLLNCNYDVEIGLAIGFGILLVIVIIIVIWAKRCPYETKVLVYKFLRIHPQDKYKVDDQETTVHDLYVSFDDEDIHIRQWVLRKLAKRLEEEKPKYKVFVPVRDLLGGNEKADDIIKNMEMSRRVLIILSHKYDDNEWCRFECQRAEILEHNDGRVIFIKYHPEAEEMIETEPWKSRVKGRKIFSPGDKRSERRWFWDKLKYELPVR